MKEFEDLYRRHAPDVLRFALYLTGDRAEAEDIASETFVRVFTAFDRIRMPTVKGYLFTIARNLHRQGWRGRARRSSLDAGLADQAPGPDVQAQASAQLAQVLAALQKLPEPDRAAVLMRAQDGLSYEEIAAALDLSVAAVKVKVHRARVRLAALPGSGERR